MKKLVSFVLTLLLMFTMATSSFAASIPKNVLNTDENVTLFEGTKLEADVKTKDLKERDQVRVIVELTGKPAIEYATEKGVKVTQLDQNLLNSITNNILNEQQMVKNQITTNRIGISYHHTFSNVANGFSATVTYGDAKKIESMPGVSRVFVVNEYEKPTPAMTTSKDVIKAAETWNLGYNGEGMIVSIIDSGIDPSHKDMKVTDPSKAKLNPRNTGAIILAEGLKGKWYTNKVPYGYNYYDQNDTILDQGSDGEPHGMHVAGITAANGDANGIKGVAPEAQLLAMKVFSNDPNFPSTFSDIYLAAIEDSLKLGADVINMSLGSTASFSRPDDPEQIALSKATRNGLVLAMSAGNAGNIGYGWSVTPYAKNPDLGVVGAPGLNTDSIQVAAMEKTTIQTDAMRYKDGLIGYSKAGAKNPISTFSGQVEYVFCKLGLIGIEKGVPVDDFAGVDVAGKIALIQRGGYTEIPGNFVDKIMNAQNKGAIGVIVFNSAAGGDALMNMAYPDATGTIPAVFIGLNDGNRLKNLIASGDNKVEFKGEQVVILNPNAGMMADFSSWGTTPNLDFKPELTAPGVNIYSTYNNNSYGSMSGTSMAAPHVAGGSSLILQRVDKEFGLRGYERSLMAKNLLLSTAGPLIDKGTYNNYYGLGNFISPRREGAGAMNLLAAATTPSIVTDSKTGVSKVALYEIGNTTTFTLKVTNFSNAPVSYNLSGTVQTDLMYSSRIRNESQGVFINGTISGEEPYLGEFPISYSKNGAPINSLAVPANSSTEFNVTIDLTNAVDWYDNKPLNILFPNGSFIEGFVRLTSTNEAVPTIGIPYMGFYGKWDQAPIIDDNNYMANRTPYYGNLTVLTWLDKAADMYNFLGYTFDGKADSTKIAFSPNGDGLADEARLIATFLRNAKELEINILDKSGNKLRGLAKDYEIRKDYYNSNGSGTSKYRSSESWAWDGTINYKPAADGEYIYQVRAKVDYPGASWQEVNFPIRVDTAAPVINSISFDPAANKLTTDATDNHAIRYYELIKDGTVVAESGTGTFDVSKYIQPNQINIFTVKAYDYALNSTEAVKEIGTSNDTTIPEIFIDSPEVLGIYNTNQILVKGYVTDNTQVRELKVNNEIIPLTFDPEKNRYNFEKVFTVDNPVQYFRFEAKDTAGNVMNIMRKIFVDMKAPVIDAVVPATVDPSVDRIKIGGTVTDNMPGLKVFVNSNMEFNSNASWMYIENETPVTYDFSTFELNLNYGENIIIIEARDDAGNVSMKEYKVYRNTEAELPVSILNATVTPNKNITVLNPAVLSATASFAVDWEVTIKDYRGVVVETYTALGTASFNATWTPTAEQVKYGKFFVEFKATRGDKTDSVNMIITTKVPIR